MSATLREVPAKARRILVVANETACSSVTLDILARRAGDGAEVLVIAPALNTRMHHWMSDSDGAFRAAGERLAASLSALNLAGIDAQGWVGDADPMISIADAMPFFNPDEIVMLTHPKSRSNWLAHDVVRRARAAFGRPVVHIVVEDPERRPREPVAA
jgi:hypothetical protein